MWYAVEYSVDRKSDVLRAFDGEDEAVSLHGCGHRFADAEVVAERATRDNRSYRERLS